MIKQPKRNRPRISTTIAAYTAAVIAKVAKDKGLPNPGIAVDYIVKEWADSKNVNANGMHILEQPPIEVR